MRNRIRKGDLVYVLSGDDMEMMGRVLNVDPQKQTAIVEKVNMVTRHLRQQPMQQKQPGGLVNKEAPIPLSKLALIDPKTNEPTRIRWEFREDGTKVRVSKKTGNVI